MSYCFLSIETSGLDCKNNAVLQINAILTDDELNIKKEFSELVNPPSNLSIDDEAMSFNGLDLNECKKSKTEQEVMKEFNRFLAEGESPTLVGYNIPFALTFLKSLCLRNKLYIHGDGSILDLAMTAHYVEKSYKYSLKSTCDHFGIPFNKSEKLATPKACLELARRLL